MLKTARRKATNLILAALVIYILVSTSAPVVFAAECATSGSTGC